MALVVLVAGIIAVADQLARPIAQAYLVNGQRVPILGDRIVLERADDVATPAIAAAVRIRLVGGLAALVAMTALATYMGGYGIALLAAFGLILGGSASNQVSWLADGFVLNWIGYRVDAGLTVLTPADFAQMAGLAMIFSALTIFTGVSLAEALPAPRASRAGG